ncbi:hypothetical protein [Halopiger xanaduensis]|uniref:Uncharacterized protein n=1 Tax=Halopiger xanaduensis (strain DSM 18323 / JCM 14033 / SH-6) TaxID=797210 RepID=F8D3V0_HALXS|nr:hypothetical protein [Halopiger xanaduensis]AEH38603.1 hypothetical protein Halxa_3998 [Halopiger xanaduensis SH-6]
MGILELMLGQSGPGEQGVEGKSYKLPKANHDFVYPVAARSAELDAFQRLIRAEADAPYIEENTEELQAVFDDVLGEAEIDAAELAERNRRPRLEAEPVIDYWREQVADGDGVGVVYARPGTYSTLASFVNVCRQRDEDADDPFELPEDFSKAAALLTRLEEATDDQYRAVVHSDLLPDDSD